MGKIRPDSPVCPALGGNQCRGKTTKVKPPVNMYLPKPSAQAVCNTKFLSSV